MNPCDPCDLPTLPSIMAVPLRSASKRRARVAPAPPAPSWVRVVRSDPSAYEREVAARGVCASATTIHALLRERLCAEVCEVMVVVHLDGRNRVAGMSEVSRGGLHGCAVSPRDIFRAAVASGASGIVLVHNHPSGDPRPSAEDLAVTRAVLAAGKVLGCPLLDHVILGSRERFHSLYDQSEGGFGDG